MQLGFYRSDGQVEQFGDFPVCITLHVVEDEHQTTAFREAGDAAFQVKAGQKVDDPVPVRARSPG